MNSERINWIDSLRGLAIVLMIIFHIAFDLDLLNIYQISLYSGFWFFLARFIEFTFLILFGFSLYLSYKNSQSYSKFLKFQLWRGVKLFAIAMLITLITYFIYPQGYIRFGVLHLISMGIIMGALLVRYPKALIAMIFLSLIFGAIFNQFYTDTPLLLPFGIMPDKFYTLDYFPTFPWAALIFFGIIAARFFGANSWLINSKKIRRFIFLEKIGQKSLLIYLIHQPVLLGLIWLLSISNVLK